MYNYVRQHLSNNVKHLTSTISLEICSQIKKGLKKVNKISLRIFSELCLCLRRPGAWWIGVEWCSQVCNKPSISDRSFIMGLWWARRGLQARGLWLAGLGESLAVIGCWRVISVHCQIMMDHCPTQSSLPSSLGSSCLRSPATRLSPPPAPSSANFVPENTETRHENRNVALFSVTNISGMIFGVFRVSATADSSKASWFHGRCLSKNQ